MAIFNDCEPSRRRHEMEYYDFLVCYCRSGCLGSLCVYMTVLLYLLRVKYFVLNVPLYGYIWACLLRGTKTVPPNRPTDIKYGIPWFRWRLSGGRSRPSVEYRVDRGSTKSTGTRPRITEWFKSTWRYVDIVSRDNPPRSINIRHSDCARIRVTINNNVCILHSSSAVRKSETTNDNRSDEGLKVRLSLARVRVSLIRRNTLLVSEGDPSR